MTNFYKCRIITANIEGIDRYEKSKYVNDSKITDHYAIIPTGYGLDNLNGLSDLSRKIYEVIVRRFLAIFYPPAIYQKVLLTTDIAGEKFYSSFKVLSQEGYLKVTPFSFFKKKIVNSKRNSCQNLTKMRSL